MRLTHYDSSERSPKAKNVNTQKDQELHSLPIL